MKSFAEVLAAARASGLEVDEDLINPAEEGEESIPEAVVQKMDEAKQKKLAKGKAKMVEEPAEKVFTRRSTLQLRMPAAQPNLPIVEPEPVPPLPFEYSDVENKASIIEKASTELQEDLSQQIIATDDGKVDIYSVNFVLYSPTPPDIGPNSIVDRISNTSFSSNITIDQELLQIDKDSFDYTATISEKLTSLAASELGGKDAGLGEKNC